MRIVNQSIAQINLKTAKTTISTFLVYWMFTMYQALFEELRMQLSVIQSSKQPYKDDDVVIITLLFLKRQS